MLKNLTKHVFAGKWITINVMLCKYIILCLNKNKTCNVRYNVTMRRFRVNIFTAGKQWLFWVCVSVDLGIQHELRMRYIVICVLPGSTKFFNIMS